MPQALSTNSILNETIDQHPMNEALSQMSKANQGKAQQGRWTAEERQRFEQAIKIYGKDWKSIQRYVGSRSGT